LTRDGGRFAEAIIEVGEHDFPAWCFGKLADQVSEYAEGVALQVNGRMEPVIYKTKEEHDRIRTVIRADSVEVVAQPSPKTVIVDEP